MSQRIKESRLFVFEEFEGEGTWTGLATYNLGLMTLKGEGGLERTKDADIGLKRVQERGNKEAQQAQAQN